MEFSKETSFAQLLAGNEQKQRNKALKRLKRYLQAKSASKKNPFCHEDFLKILKGLHYCMWMQDKPLVQEELSTKITQLVHDIATVDQRCLFIKVFVETEAREWNTIDKWRVDKFMMFFRSMLTESLVMLKNLNWKKKHVDELLDIYRENMLNVDDDKVPLGLRYHFVDIYLDEVHRVGGSKINTKQFLMLLEPFVTYIQQAKDEAVASKIVKQIFDPLIKRTCRLAVNKGKSTDEGRENNIYPDLQLDVTVIIDHLFDIGKSEEMPAKKRELFYGLVKRFQDASDGIVPKPLEFPKGPSISNQMLGEAMITLEQLQMEKSEKITRKELKDIMKRRKSLLKDGKENTTEIVELGATASTTENDSKVVVGKKRKHSEPDTSDEPVNKVKKKGKQNKEEQTNSNKSVNKEENTDEKTNKVKGKQGRINKIWKSKKERQEKKSQVISNGEEGSTDKLDEQVGCEAQIEDNSTKDISVINEPAKPVEESADKKKKVQEEKNEEGKSKTAVKRRIDQTDGMSSSKMPEANKCEIPSQTMTEDLTNDNASKSKPHQNGQSIIQIKPSDDLEEGEVEIFVPSKKYKGRISMSPAKFADFESAKTPVAFVKRALSKANKNSTATPAYIKKKTETPGSNTALTGSAKKVSFNMKRNKSQSFKESLKSPIVPFNPTKTPDQSILKTPTRNTPNPDSVRRNARRGSTATPPSSGSLKTLKTPKRTMALKHVRVATPKMCLQKKVTRKVASDFFAL